MRPGVIPLTELEAEIGKIAVAGDPAEPGAHASPGMHARHYRPVTRLFLLRAGEGAPTGKGAWLRIGREMPADAREYAAVLYATLHRLDAEGFDWIAVERPPETPACRAEARLRSRRALRDRADAASHTALPHRPADRWASRSRCAALSRGRAASDTEASSETTASPADNAARAFPAMREPRYPALRRSGPARSSLRFP